MGQPLRILIVEDSEDDAELLLREIRRGGFEPAWERVDSAKGMNAALARQSWDLVASDYVMPGFGGLEALAIFHAKGLDVPFLIVSGHIGEDIAVASMKAGAADYLMKDRLARLVPAVKRALAEAETRRAHKRANEALRASEERFRQLAENIGMVFFLFERPTRDCPGSISYVSPAYERIWGSSCDSLLRDTELWLKAVHPQDRQRLLNGLPQMAQGTFNDEFRLQRADRKICWIQFRTFPVRNEEGLVYRVAALAEDITERKRAEDELAATARQLAKTVAELRVAQDELRQSNDKLTQARQQLEKRVQERTADLVAANTELREQINERKRLENELLEIAENERRRIGFDLHDDIGQKLMGVSLLLKAMERSLAQKNLPEATQTEKIQALINEVVNHTHNLAHCFSSLDAQGDDLCALLKELGSNVKKTFHISCSFRVTGALPELPQDVTSQLYKIAQESVSNAIKHGKATQVTITLAQRNGGLNLIIRNNGVPFKANREPNKRMGLRIMNYRARTIGGEFEIRPNGNAGAVVSCRLPFTNGHKIAKISFGALPPPRTSPGVSLGNSLAVNGL